MVDLGRIHKELKEIERDKASGVTVQVRDNNLQKLLGFVPGDEDECDADHADQGRTWLWP